MNDTENSACPRIQTRGPCCHNNTLTVNSGHLLCTWLECKDPTLIDRVSELVRAGDRAHKAGGGPEELKALASATGSAGRLETPRTDARKYGFSMNGTELVSADFARQLEREIDVLCQFINDELKMTANDPRIAELEKRIAALPND